MKRYHRDHISRSINITAVSQGSLVNLYTASVATTCSGFYMTGVSHKGVQEVGATGFAGTPYVGLILVVPEGIPDSEVTNNTGVIPPTLSLGNVPLTGNPANIPIQEIENDLGNRITESARRRRLPGGLADPELNLDEAADEVLNQTQELYKPSKQIITHFAGVAFWGPGYIAPQSHIVTRRKPFELEKGDRIVFVLKGARADQAPPIADSISFTGSFSMIAKQ